MTFDNDDKQRLDLSKYLTFNYCMTLRANSLKFLVYVPINYLKNARITTMMADKSNPASLNALGNASAPAPTMRLKIYTNPALKEV